MRLAAALLTAGLTIPAYADDVDDKVLAAAEFDLWAMSGAAIAMESDGAVAGSAAAAFAVLRMMDTDDAAEIERLLDVAEIWLLADQAGQGMAGLRSAEAARRLICFMTDQGPGRAHEMIGTWGPPEENPATCQEDYADWLFAWEDAFADVQPNGVTAAQIRLKYGDGEWRGVLKRSELLEIVAETITGSFGPTPVRQVIAAPCDGSGFESSSGTVRLCYGDLDRYKMWVEGRDRE